MNDYISPRMEYIDLKIEGVLCSSFNFDSDPNDLPDYSPSMGNWND